MKYSHIARYVSETLWAITPDKMAELLAVLAYRAAGHEFTPDEIRARIGDDDGEKFATPGQGGGFVEQESGSAKEAGETKGPEDSGPGTYSVYHGTNADFQEFDESKIGSATDEGFLGAGIYFSTDPNIGRSNNRTIKAQVTLKKPLEVMYPTWGANKSKLVSAALGLDETLTGQPLTGELQKQGYDGVILDYSPVQYHHKEIMVMKASQIKVGAS